uniref:LITAF domain-containing protein n=1 Tax=Bombyx mori TaxID=7091 RepID=A0A8R2R622_BOMMO|nr:uncharacterized protein LOC119631196 isoform X1 [Bombyx mori]
MQTDLYHVVPTVPTQQFITVQAPQMGPKPARYTCPSCKASITTRVEYVSATKTTCVLYSFAVYDQGDLSGVDIAETTQNPPPYNNQMQTDLYHVVPTVPTQQFITVQAPQMGPKPARYTCPSCKASITTRVEYVSATKTHLCALLLCCL